MATIPQISVLISAVLRLLTREDLVTREKIVELVRRLVAAYEPLRVVAFGSRARGTNRPGSDLDVAVIVEDGRKTSVTAWDRGDLDMPVDVDVLVFPLSRHRRLACSMESVNYATANEGVVLYEREPRLEPFYPQMCAEEIVSAKIESLNILVRAAWLDEVTLNLAGIPHEIAGFHGQQALEKLMKVWLGAYDVVPKHTHELKDLNVQLAQAGLLLPPLHVDLDKVTAYAVVWRYYPIQEEARVNLDVLRLAVARLREHVVAQAAEIGLALSPP